MTLEKIWIAADHAGFELKDYLKKQRPDLPWVDLGPHSADSVDYPDYTQKLATAMKEHSLDDGSPGTLKALGVLVCGSGQGMAIGANRYPFIRAALCWDETITRLSRSHNNANVLCMGSRLIDHNLALGLLDLFIETPFEGGRHSARVAKLSKIGPS